MIDLFSPGQFTHPTPQHTCMQDDEGAAPEVPQAQSAAQQAAQEAAQQTGGLGHYQSRDNIPPPPSDKPWLKHNGECVVSDGKFFRVAAKLVKRGGCSFYILAFTAHKESGHRKSFAASRNTEAQREQAAREWLLDESDSESDDDSTQEQATGGTWTYTWTRETHYV